RPRPPTLFPYTTLFRSVCGRRGVRYLTLFAFSSENWRRPQEEVSLLMRLFVQTLEKEVGKLSEQGVRLRVVGDISAFEPRLQARSEEHTSELQSRENLV